MYVTSCLSLAAFNSFSLSLTFDILVMCLGMILQGVGEVVGSPYLELFQLPGSDVFLSPG